MTVRVKLCIALGGTPFAATIVKLYGPAVPDCGVPLNVAEPFPLSAKLNPVGNAPVSLKAGIGSPLAVTVKEPAVCTVKVALLPLVVAGA